MKYELLQPTSSQRLFVASSEGEGSFVPPAHKPPTEGFLDALRNPRHVSEEGIIYAVYTFNQHVTSKPPLVYIPPLEHNNGVASRSGSRELNALVTHMNRPIITIDMPGIGNSGRPRWRDILGMSIEGVGKTTNEILDAIGAREVDLMGICLGGAIAAETARQRGASARTLLTFATPGFEPDLLYRLREKRKGNTEEARINRASDDLAADEAERDDNITAGELAINSLPPIHVKKRRRLAIHAKLGLDLLGDRTLMKTLPEGLHPSTKWHDFVGADDVLTSWQNHVRATSGRVTPTEQTVLEGAGHDWFQIRIPYTARLAELALEGYSPDPSS